MNVTTPHTIHDRTFICALAACVLTVLLSGGISQVPVQAAPHAVLLQA